MPAEANSKHIKALLDHDISKIELIEYMIKHKRYLDEKKLKELQGTLKKLNTSKKYHEKALKSKLKEEAKNAKKKK